MRALLVAAAAAAMDLLASASADGAGAVTWRDLAANPARYIGKEVVIASAYCGNAGDDPGYVCSTDGLLYVRPLALAEGPAKLKLDESCGGMDWVEKSAFCRVKLRFTPSGFHTNTDYEPGKTAIVIDAAEAAIAF